MSWFFNTLLSVSLFSAARGEKDGYYFYERYPEGYGVLKGPRGNVKLERSGGLDYLVDGEGQRDFPALLTPASVDGGYCRVDNVDIGHLRGGHLKFDPRCTTCTSMTMRRRQHRRQDDRETAGAGEKFVRISLEDCHWPTMGQNTCWLRCAEKHVSVLSER